MTPEQAAEVRDAVADERGNDEPFDLCVWGLADQVASYEGAGVTWLVTGAAPEDPLADVTRTIGAGPQR